MNKLVLLAIVGYVAYSYLGNRRQLAVAYPDGTVETFADMTPELDAALRRGKAVIVEGGTIVHEFTQSRFMDGWLLDGCPINTVLGYGWQPGQVEALQDAGIAPYCEVV